MNEMYDETGVPWGAASPLSGPTPMTDSAQATYESWNAYVKQYGHIPEAMEQAPDEADPFYVSRNLERLLAEAVGALELLKEMCDSATPWKYSEDGIKAPINKALARIKAAKEQI